MKGITPVVAVVLLIAVTVAASGTLYSLMQDQQEYVEDNAPTMEFNTDILNVESCWHDTAEDQVHLQVRNEHPENAINASALSIYYEYQPVENQADPDLVNPQRTFRIEIDEDPTNNPGGGDIPTVEILNRGELTHRCFNIDTN